MFIKTMRKSTLTTGLLLIVSVGAGWLLLAWPGATAAGISRGLALCSSIIIPSLFPFLVLAGFVVKSGLSASVGRRLEAPTRFLFGLPGSCAAAIIISFIGGYPAGGITVGELVRQGTISRAQGRRMLCFCVNGGPAFIISAVGAGMLGSVKYGVMLYGAHIAASIVLGILLRIGEKTPGKDAEKKVNQETPEPEPQPAPRLSPASAFVDSVNTACRSMLMMCGFIVLFAAVLSLADGSGFSRSLHSLFGTLAGSPSSSDPLSSIINCLFPCLLEVSCGSVEAARTGAAAPLLLGLALGWGGLSVHCQIAAALYGLKLVGWRFFAARALHALIGGVFSLVLFRYVPVATTAFNTFSQTIVKPYATSAAASAALLLLCALFLLTAALKPDETKTGEKGYGKKGKTML